MVSITKLTIVKLLELLLVCCIIGMHWNVFERTEISYMTASTAGGFLIILVGSLLGALTSTPVNRRVDLLYTFIGLALFIICGGLLINDYNRLSKENPDRHKGLAAGSLCIIEGALFLVDAIFTFRGES